jgi:poly(3-hydroxybutyrate) depolymerase
MLRFCFAWAKPLFGLLLASSTLGAGTEPSFVLGKPLALGPVTEFHRTAFHLDPIEALIVSGRWGEPKVGEVVATADGSEFKWEEVELESNGAPSRKLPRGTYVYVPVHSDFEQVVLLNAVGHSLAYVNGEPRAGDLYAYGNMALPIRLHPGKNDLLFLAGRGAFRIRLLPVEKPVALDMRDRTLPDLIRGEGNDTWGAVLIANSTTETLKDLALRTSSAEGRITETRLKSVSPMSTCKVGFRIRHSGRSKTNRAEIKLELVRRTSRLKRQSLDSTTLKLSLVASDSTHRETFVSDIDGSVQYFAVTPGRPLDPDRPPRALVLSTHGAGVEAIGQARSYRSKSWAHIVAPTNRRKFGFDWEDWGRLDAMEVLAIAQEKFGTDPRRTYLTGHSMGGHGTWHLGATYPDRFAALGPSAGWISFFSYARGKVDESTNALHQLVHRATGSSDTLAMVSNYLHHGIYILHGDADNNVPVREARNMKAALEPFHRNFTYHEQPGAGHWWGNRCVDWPPIFDMFARHRIPDDDSVTEIHFTTMNPGVSASSHWVTVEAQEHALVRSVVDVNWQQPRRRFTATTENVARLALSLEHLGAADPVTVELDGQQLTNIAVSVTEPKVWFERKGGKWEASGRPAPAWKGPHRYGPFKEAFRHRMMFVYGTKGSEAENRWAFNKARYDAETFRYRGNGSVEVIPDLDFDPGADPDRGVILYGNADINGAWDSLLGDSPVQVSRSGVEVDGRELGGTDLACLFLRPRPGSDVASVGVVAGTGLTGLRLTDRMPYFVSGVAYPDVLAFGPEVLAKGPEGARVAGFFGNDWSVAAGEFEWRE